MIKKNILYICKDGVLGGSSQSLYLLLKKINGVHNISVILCQNGPLADKLKALKIPVFIFPFKGWRQFKNIINNIKAVQKLKNFILEKKIRIIHCNSYEVNPLMVLSADKKVKTICHVRDMISSKKAKKYMLQRTDLVIAISNAVKKSIRSVHSNIKMIYNGVDVQAVLKAKGNLKRYVKLPNKIFKIGLIGNCEQRKRQEDLIKAGLLLCKKNKNFHFFFIGNNRTEYCKKINELITDHKENFHFIGHVENIFSIIKDLDIVTITSAEEAFGRTAIEAMICKKGVIGTRTGGLPEVIKHRENGLLYQPENYMDLAKQIFNLYSNKRDLKKFGLNGYKQIKKRFTLMEHVDSILKVYQ